jgi:methyltransferase-like protein
VNGESLPAYDAVPYESTAVTATNPDTLATLARLRGLRSPLPDQCRILELGCAEGGNLIPLALALPGTTFVGVDLSVQQIRTGQQLQADLGLANLELRHGSILEIDASYGTFDYILCHGVYSWVAPAVQTRILAICRERLAANGVAYVSYNVYPGWGLTNSLRAMLRYQVRGVAEGPAQLRAARSFVARLGELLRDEERPYTGLLREDLTVIARAGDPYLAHEYLEEENHPIYFHEFVARAQEQGLQYLGETVASTMVVENLRPEVAQTLTELARDPIHLEQLMDLLRGRSFRNTLLCHAEVPLTAGFVDQDVPSMFIASPLAPLRHDPDLLTERTEDFQTAQGETLTTNNPLVKTALACLAAAWPWPIPFETLWSAVAGRFGTALDPSGKAILARHLLRGFLGDVIELHAAPPRYVRTATIRPLATPWARLQARRGAQVTNRRHRVVALEEVLRRLLIHLDGQHDRAALRLILERELAGGTLTPPDGPLDTILQLALERLAEQALLVG